VSTGRPKGIVNSQRNLLQRVAQSINAAHLNAAHLNADDRFLTVASPCTIVAVRDIMTALLAGASIHLLDPQRAGAREISTVIRAEAIAAMVCRRLVPRRGSPRSHRLSPAGQSPRGGQRGWPRHAAW